MMDLILIVKKDFVTVAGGLIVRTGDVFVRGQYEYKKEFWHHLRPGSAVVNTRIYLTDLERVSNFAGVTMKEGD